MHLEKLRVSIIAAAVLFLIPSSYAQTYTFRHIDTGDGLSCNSAMCCIQDDFGFVWVATKDGIFRYDGFEFDALSTINPDSYQDGKIFKMAIDNEGIIWFSADKQIGFFNTRTNETGLPDCIPPDSYYSLCSDLDGNIWASGLSTTVRYDKKEDKAQVFQIRTEQSSQSLKCGSDGNLWLCSSGNLLRYDIDSHLFEEIPLGMEGFCPQHIEEIGDGIYLIADNRSRLFKFDSRTVRMELFSEAVAGQGANYILVKSVNEFWVGTAAGIYIIDGNGQLKTHIGDKKEYELSNGNIISMFQDREKNIWISTYHGGINLWTNSSNGITLHQGTSERENINGRIVRAIASGADSDIWLGTEDGGLCTYRSSTGEMTDIGSLNGYPEYNIQSFLNSGREMWVGTFGNGILKMDLRTGMENGRISLPNNSVTFLFKSHDNKVYAGTSNGLFVCENGSEEFVLKEETEGCFIHCIIEDSFGTIWLACFGQGVWQKRSSSDKFTQVLGTDTGVKISSDFTTSLFEDSSHRIWVSTEGIGVFHFQISDRIEPVFINKENGLPSSICCSVIQDKNGGIWIATTMGLVELDSSHEYVKRTYLDYGTFLSSSFCHNAKYLSPDGTIYLGTFNGWMTVNPDALSASISRTILYIKDAHVMNGTNNVQLHEDGKSILRSKEIFLTHKDASAISLKFCAPVFSSLSTPRYKYTLKGSGADISSTTTSNSIVLSNLSSGKYLFNVTEAGDSTGESSRSLTIHVKPPFAASKFAFVLYGLLSALGIMFLYKLSKERRKERERLVMAEMEQSKQKEVYNAKASFFTTVTHELRTPLTLIKLPIDKIIEEKKYSPEIREDLLTIRSNTDKLIEVTNHFLEMKKQDDKEMSFNFMNADICKVVRKVCDYYPGAITDKTIDFNFNIPYDSLIIVTVPEAIYKVLNNLLSTAVNNCEKMVGLNMEHDRKNEMISLKIDFDGPDFRRKQAEDPFNQFYYMSGDIALALGGSIRLDRDASANSFVFTLPAKPEDPSLVSESGITYDESEKDDDYVTADNPAPRILLVEDDAELRNYMAHELGREYRTVTAGNGQEALGIMKTEKIDMVISDIMMPVMNGCQLCEAIKSNIEFCHIPVILLTAVAGADTRISSLKVGADHFIEKPFSINLLRATIQSLFTSRELMYKQFTESPLIHFNSVSSNKIDQEFMDNLHNIILEHLSDENLDIDSLTAIMRTSKSTLYRKVKANTGQKVNEYIKIFRLKKAAELLAEGKYRINEVAYLTGFSSASYFATSFLKQFNISPSNFVKSIKDTGGTE